MEPVENYGHVQIFPTVKNHFFYSLVPQVIQGRRGKDLINVLLSDDNLEEIMFIGETKPIKVYHSKYGMINTNIKITEHEAEMFISEAAIGSRKILNNSNPLLDATLPDGSRLNATIPPASIDGSTFTIRKFKKNMITVLDLIRTGTMSAEIGAFLWTCIDGLNMKPANIIFSGGTGSGKTTNLNALSMFIPFDSRIISIEDTVELQMVHEHHIRLTTVPNTNVDMGHLLINTLRMRPDRIILGEVRGSEAKSLFTAMNTGHEGCMGTMHANTTKESLIRITEEPMSVPTSMLSGLDLIIMQQRIISGKQHSRHITDIAEIPGMTLGKDIPKTNLLYKWNPSKKQSFKTGIPSRLKEKITSAAGIMPKEFDNIVKRREQLLLNALSKRYQINELLNMIMQNS